MRRRKNSYKEMGSLVLREGSWTSILRFLGTFRPIRLLEDSKKIWIDAPFNFIPDVKVTSVKKVGKKTVQGLSTSTKTYIANGLFCHNSQFSFGIFNGEIKCRSRGKELILDAPEKMFIKAIETVKELAPKLKDGWTYRGEYLQKAKHNVLAYDRAPDKFIILFDINTGQENYISYEEKKKEAERLGLEIVPKLYEGKLDSPEKIMQLMETVSILGGQKIEGMVFKNYNQFGRDKKVLMAKHVSEAFKEVHRKEWKVSNPGKKDIIDQLVESYKTEARWNKAIQHLAEAGVLTNTPKDIRALLKEVGQDTKKECEEEIKEKLFKWAWPQIQRRISGGLPEWYKNKLMKSQFEDKGEE
jgi:hypothetical protein